MAEKEEIRPWQYSVKLECNAKGFIQPSIKVEDDDLAFLKISKDEREMLNIEWIAAELLERVVKQLRDRGFKVATDIDMEKLV